MATIGVLALQGAFSKHGEMVASIGHRVVYVRRPSELERIDALVIPGGESTVIRRQIAFIEMEQALEEFVENKGVFGTCAGLILLAKKLRCKTFTPFGWMDIEVERNGYGRQLESFSAPVVREAKRGGCFEAMFIRAPRIRAVGEAVQVLARLDDEPVLVRQGKLLAATFHPELSGCKKLYQSFIKEIL